VFDITGVGAVVLAAGLGTRLDELHIGILKPLIPVKGRPFLWWLVNWLLGSVDVVCVVTTKGCSEFHNLLGDLPQVILVEGTARGTSVDLTLGVRHLQTDTVLVCNADTVVDLSLKSLLLFHGTHGEKATIALSQRTDVQNPNSFAVDQTHLVVRSLEDGLPRDSIYEGANWYGASTGVFILPRYLLIDFGEKSMRSVEQEVLPLLIKNNFLFAFDNESRFVLDYGTPERLCLLRRYEEIIVKILEPHS